MKAKNGVKKMIMIKRSEFTFSDLQKQYLKKCEVNNLSEYTIQFYKVSCNTFNKFVNIEELKASDINRELIDDYILHLKQTGVKDITINTYVQGISPIIKYGMSMGIIEEFGFKEIRTTVEIKEVYTNNELEIMLKKPVDCSFAEYRNWVIINFLLATGIRALELRSIKIQDIDLSSDMLIVKRTKSRKQRYVPISNILHLILMEYLDYRKANSTENFLFCNEFGEQLPRTTLQMAITKYCKKRGVNKHSIHLFRHTFAKIWIVNKGDAFTLQKILGHSNLRMVSHYINLYADDLKQNFNSFCALEIIGGKRSKIR